MDKYTIFICDDDKEDREKVENLIKEYGNCNECSFILEQFESGTELVKMIKKAKKPDIIFLDINMKEIDGIEAARKIREFLPDIPIVLVTAYINYALEGYKVKASRFLVKDELQDTISECLNSIISEISRRPQELDFSFVEGNIRLKLDDLSYIETDAHVQVFHVGNKTYRIYKKLEEVEKELSGFGFVRVHKSFVVNLRYVTKISSYRLYLSTGEEMSVPRDRYNEVKNRYALYKGGVL